MTVILTLVLGLLLTIVLDDQRTALLFTSALLPRCQDSLLILVRRHSYSVSQVMYIDHVEGDMFTKVSSTLCSIMPQAKSVVRVSEMQPYQMSDTQYGNAVQAKHYIARLVLPR